jgi:hypothetical protein
VAYESAWQETSRQGFSKADANQTRLPYRDGWNSEVRGHDDGGVQPGVEDLSMGNGASGDDGLVVVVVSMAAAVEVELAGREADEPAANRVALRAPVNAE